MRKISLIEALLVVAVIVMSLLYGCERNKRVTVDNLLEAQTDSLLTYQDKYGRQVTKTTTFQADNAQLFLQLKSKDSTTRVLQKLVKKYKSELAKGGSITILEGSTTLDTIQVTDTIWLADLDSGFVLADSIHNEWVTLDYGFKFKEGFTDSSYASLKVRNSYSIVIGEEKQGFLGLGKRKPFVEVTNLNPYTQTKNLKTFEVKDDRKKKWVIGPQLGLTLGQSFQLIPTVGAGVTYKLIEF